MDPKLLTALGAIAAVVIVGLVARRGGSGAAPGVPVAPTGETPPRDARADGDEPADDAVDAEVDADDEASLEEDDPAVADVVAVTSDGYALVPDRHAVRLVPPEETGEAWKVGAGMRASNLRGEAALSMSWHAGDFSGARVVRGAADEGPWRFEAMGREGEYTAFVFETREGADAALAAFESRGIVRVGRDEHGDPAPPSSEQFDEARRVFLETEAALDAPDEDGEPGA